MKHHYHEHRHEHRYYAPPPPPKAPQPPKRSTESWLRLLAMFLIILFLIIAAAVFARRSGSTSTAVLPDPVTFEKVIHQAVPTPESVTNTGPVSQDNVTSINTLPQTGPAPQIAPVPQGQVVANDNGPVVDKNTPSVTKPPHKKKVKHVKAVVCRPGGWVYKDSGDEWNWENRGIRPWWDRKNHPEDSP